MYLLSIFYIDYYHQPMSFNSLGLSKSLLSAVERENYKAPYPIQTQAIPAILASRDILGIAKTGSGKTASYVLPILQQLENLEITKNRRVKVLVLVPTRELATQVQDVFRSLSSSLPQKIKSLAVYGGVSINPQMKAVFGTQVLIATPGRLLDLVQSNAVELGGVQTLVLDEADKMLNLGFKKEMTQIFRRLPKSRQNLLFSATLSEDLEELNQVLLYNPLVVKIEALKENIDNIEQLGYFVDEEKKGPLLRHIIKNGEFAQALVFTSSTYKADNVADKLRKNGIEASAIHSKKSQSIRTESLRKFKEGSIKVLVATDLLSRGIDIDHLPCVINYELPRSPKDYVHRIGRTGRAEAQGLALSLITPEDKHHFKVIQKKMGKWVTMIESEKFDF